MVKVFQNWIIVILSLGWFTRSVTSKLCQSTPRIVYAIDSSKSMSSSDFNDQRTLIQSVVLKLEGNPADVAVVLYNTNVHVNITFNQFAKFVDLGTAISSLPFMDPASSGSDLEKLFNTTFTKTPEVFLMLKREINATYPGGFKVPSGKQLGGVKKIAVTFGTKSNIKDISDFHAVIHVADTVEFSNTSVIEEVAETLCYALVSTPSSNTRTATSIHTSSESGSRSVSTSSAVGASLTSSANGTGMSSEHVMQRTSFTGPPFVTSALNVSYISTQSVMNGSQGFPSTTRMTQTSVFVSSVPYTVYLLTHNPATSSSKEKKTPVMAVTSGVKDTSQMVHSVAIAPSITVEATVMESRANHDRGNHIKKLLQDRDFVLNLNGSHIDVENRTFLQDYFNKAASLLRLGDFLDRALNSSRQKKSTPLEVLHALEKFTVMIGEVKRRRNMGNLGDLKFHAGGLVSQIFLVNMSTFQGMQLGTPETDNHSVFLPREVFSHVAANETKETGLLVSLAFDPFQVLQELHAFDSFEENHTVASKIVNVFTKPPPLSQLSKPVKITMQHSKNGYHAPQCVFWDYTQRGAHTKFGKWSKQGCYVFSRNERYTECHCNHMTNYAVLMRTTEQVLGATDERVLTVLTYVGCSFSIVGVFLTAITFLSLPVIKSEITKIHLNLSIAVGVAQVLFLAAGSENLVQREVICKLYTGLLFYFFMSVFTWMFVEGVHLYQMIVIAFVSRNMVKFYLALGWGLPACAVVIASSIAREGFGTSNFCWLSSVGGAIWGFVGPAVAVIGVNLYVLVCVLRVRINMNKKEGSKAQFRTSARVSLVLLPLLGISWIFGVLAVNDDTVVFQYIFTISNSIQGLLIFIFHCVGNSEVRHEFQRKVSNLNLTRSLTSPSSPVTACVSQIPLEVNPNRKREAWVGKNI